MEPNQKEQGFDLTHYRLMGSHNAEMISPRQRHRKDTEIRGEFLKGPIPLVWLTKACACGGKALNVGLALWFEGGRKRSNQVKLTSQVLQRFCVERKAKYRALELLENAGLISIVAKAHGRSATILLHE